MVYCKRVIDSVRSELAIFAHKQTVKVFVELKPSQVLDIAALEFVLVGNLKESAQAASIIPVRCTDFRKIIRIILDNHS